MKKLLFISTIFISTITLSSFANAQGTAFNPRVVTPATPYAESGSRIVNEMEVNINAARDFKKKYKNATDVKWVKNENGASVYFTNDGVKMRASYNTKGKKEYTLSYYDETKMDADLRRLVRSSYYDHNIVIVTEVIRNNQLYYLVKMENENEFLTLKVTDEEMTVFEKTVKGK